MATVPHVTAWAGSTKFQAAWFLLNRVYVSSRQIHKDLDVLDSPTTAEPDCELCFKVTWRWEPPSSATRQMPTLTDGWLPSPDKKAKGGRASRLVNLAIVRRWPSRLKESRSALINRAPLRFFFVIFLSVKANARVYNAVGARLALPSLRRGSFTYAPDNNRKTLACDSASLGSKPRQPTNQSTQALVFRYFGQGPQPDLKSLA
jgi:hypothetical protein